MWKYRPAAFILISLAFLLDSCAYMQSHKIVREAGTHYVGCELKQNNFQLVSSGDQWYLAAPKVNLKRSYPLFYDEIYRDDESNMPVLKPIKNSEDGLIYIPVSRGTATVLQRVDGYADLSALIEESVNCGVPAVTKLPHATYHTILAQIDSKSPNPSCYIQKAVPEKPLIILKLLSTLDRYSLDIAGTLAYNVTLPVTAPFRFFWDFFTED